MKAMRITSIALLLFTSVGLAQEPQGSVSIQPARWRSVRQVIHLAAEQTGFRWAMPDTISRRALVGTVEKKEQPVGEVLADLCKQTGLRRTVRNGVVVFDVGRDDRRKELVGKLAGADRRARLAAIAELAWLSDSLAWPELARVVIGDDAELSLAAAHALRRLDGEKLLDWRLFGVSQEDPEFRPMSEPATPWQTPLGLAFPNSAPLAALQELAASPYIPLREAAARLAAGNGANGKAFLGNLARDPSPIVRAAAERSLVAFAEPKKTPPVVRKSDGQKPWWELPPPDFKAAAEELAKDRDHDTVWRIVGRRVAYQSTPEAIQVMLDHGKSKAKWGGYVTQPLAEFCGGPDVIDWFRVVAGKHSDYGSQQGWALWGLGSLQDGEELAKSLRPALENRAYWSAPPEYTAARGAGIYAIPALLARMETRGHWVCLSLGYIGGPDAVEALLARLDHKDPGVAVAAAKGLGDACAYSAVRPLVAQLKHPDRLRRHWAVLALGRIGGPEAAAALRELLVEEEKRKDRMVRKAAADLLTEIAPWTPDVGQLMTRVDADDKNLVPEYRPRNPRLGDDFPVNTEVHIKEHQPVTYSSIGETRAAMDWANRLMLRYGGCSPCYSNECFAFDPGTGTWFPVRAADHYCHLFNEIRPIPGCSRGMTFDGVNKLVWIGHAIGSSSGPTAVTHNRGNGLGAYDAALDRFYPCSNSTTMAKAYSGEPAKFYAFDYDDGLVISSTSGGQGVGVLDAKSRETRLVKGPEKMPSMDEYRPPAFAYDPIAKLVMCTRPGLEWKLLTYDAAKNTYRVSDAIYPGSPSKQIMGGLVYDSLNRSMILIGGVAKETGTMPTCVWDRSAGRWIDVQAKEIGKLGKGLGTCVYDPEHNVVLELHGGAYRYKAVPVGTRAYYGGAIGKADP